MLIETIFLVKCMPKISIFYVLFSLLNGMAISNIVLGFTIFFDLLDWIPTN
jgi:hypothetical protein